MKFSIFISLLLFSNMGLADPRPTLSVKDRLRVLLWTEGLKLSHEPKKDQSRPVLVLPEEIERPLRHF
jgi:hypothetical protein